MEQEGQDLLSGAVEDGDEVVSGCRVAWFEGYGHFPHWDQPRKTVELILRIITDTAVDETKTYSGKVYKFTFRQ